MRKYHLVLLGIATFVLTACGSSVPDPITVEIDMTEYAFSPNEITLQVGQEVTLILTNSGTLDHELMIGNGVELMNGQPSSYLFDFFREGGVMPSISGGGMLMTHGVDDHDEEDAMSDMDMGDNNSSGDMDMGNNSSNEDMAMDDDHAEEEGSLMIMMVAGVETTTVNFTVTDDMVGDWEMGCFELDGVHYSSGMVGKVIVTP